MRFLIVRLINRVSREFPVFNLRLPDELKDRVTQSARKHKRSQNAEYLHRLEQSFQHENVMAALLEEIRGLRQDVAELKPAIAGDNDEAESS